MEDERPLLGAILACEVRGRQQNRWNDPSLQIDVGPDSLAIGARDQFVKLRDRQITGAAKRQAEGIRDGEGLVLEENAPHFVATDLVEIVRHESKKPAGPLGKRAVIQRVATWKPIRVIEARPTIRSMAAVGVDDR